MSNTGHDAAVSKKQLHDGAGDKHNDEHEEDDNGIAENYVEMSRYNHRYNYNPLTGVVHRSFLGCG